MVCGVSCDSLSVGCEMVAGDQFQGDFMWALLCVVVFEVSQPWLGRARVWGLPSSLA